MKKARTLRGYKDLKADPHNANRGTERGQVLVRSSLEEVGAVRGVAVAADGGIIAGHKTLKEAEALGLRLRFVESDGKDLVVVVRKDLRSGDQKAARAGLLDNRAGELDLEWDPEQLRWLREHGVDLMAGEAALWSEEELKKLLGEADAPGEFPELGTTTVSVDHECPKCGFKIPCKRPKEPVGRAAAPRAEKPRPGRGRKRRSR